MARSASPSLELWLVRHGETEWSKAMRHTGRSDIPLTEAGCGRARALAPLLGSHDFDQVLCSPLTRARQTARLAGFGGRIRLDDDLAEWDYGAFEGRTTAELDRELGGFSIWTTPVVGGETLDQVAARADRVLERLASGGERHLLFSHGHLLRILAARWLGLPPDAGRLLALDAGGISLLGLEHRMRVVRAWNLSPLIPGTSGPSAEGRRAG